MEAASNESYDIFDEEFVIRQNISRINPVRKMMARQQKTRGLARLEHPRAFKGKAYNHQQQQQQQQQQ